MRSPLYERASSLRTRPAAWFSLAALLVAIGCLIPSCRADDSIKRGAVGEFCNGRDDQCRDPLICEQGVCIDTGTSTEQPLCEQVCRTLEECNTGETRCELDCRQTVENWSEEAVETFTSCLTEEKSCEELRENDGDTARDACYRQIELDEEREERCYDFRSEAQRCGRGDAAIDEMTRSCLQFARTRPLTNESNPSQAWSNTDACVERISDNICAEIVDCLNTTFLSGSDQSIQVRPQ